MKPRRISKPPVGKVALRDTYTAKEKDFSALISKLKDAKIDAVYIGGYHNDVALIMRQSA